jgi:hypothetical protein
LPEEHWTWYEKIRKIIFEKLKTIDSRYNGFEKFDDARQVPYKNFKKTTFSLTLRDMATLWFPAVPKDYISMYTTSSAVADNYIRFICEYLNQVGRSARNRESAGEGQPGADNYKSCGVILDSSTLDDELQDEHSFGNKVDVLANSLDEMNMTKEDLRS